MKTLYSLILLCCISSAASSQVAWTNYSAQTSPLPDNSVHSIAIINDSTAWIGTEGGLTKLSGSVWTAYPVQPGGLTWADVRSIYVDNKTGSKWFGTYNGGLCSYNDTVWTNFRTTNSPIPDDFVRSIAFDTAGVKWVGAGGGGGLSKIDTANNWTIYSMMNSIIGSNNIAALYVDSVTNVVYAGTVNGGMLEIQDTALSLYTIQNSGLPDNTLLDITKDNLNNLWIATPGNGLVVKLPAFGWFKYIPVNSSILSYGVTSVAFDNNTQLLWGGTYDAGLFRKDGSNFTHFMSTNSPLSDDDVQCVKIGPDGRIWIGTRNAGLFILDAALLTSIDDPALKTDLVVYPNPSSQGFVHFSSAKICSNATITDIAGRIVLNESVNDTQHTFETSSFAKGMYLIQFEMADGTRSTSKIILR